MHEPMYHQGRIVSAIREWILKYVIAMHSWAYSGEELHTERIGRSNGVRLA